MLLQLPHYSHAEPYENKFFPYSFGVYSTLNIWVESKPSHGQRIGTQSYDPYRKDWNNSKFTEYCDLAFLTFNINSFSLEEQLINLSDISDDQLALLIKKYYLTPEQTTVVIRYLNSGRLDMPTDNLVWYNPENIPSFTNRNVVPELFLEPNKYPPAIALGPVEVKRRKSRRVKNEEEGMSPEQLQVYRDLLKKM